MDITPTTLIVVGIVCVVLGFIASSMLNMLKEEPPPPGDEDTPAPPGGRKGKYTPLARLWRERGTQQMVVELDGRSFIAPAGLDADQRARLETAARDLRAWLGMGLAAPVEAAPAPSIAAARPPEGGQPAPVTPPPAATVRAARPAPAVAPAIHDEPAASAGPKSIVMQIEDILQDMIAGTSIEHRGVHLSEDPARGVIVMVGLERFEGIDAVTDPEIKAAIRAAVAQWEGGQ